MSTATIETKTIKVPERLFREATIRAEGEGADQRFRMSISSDEPYLRYDYWNDEEYWEVLSHAPGDIDEARLKAGLPILFNHSRDQHLARATKYSNNGHRIELTDFIWSESDFAKSKRSDAVSGSLPDTSVGYQIDDEGECIGAKDGKPIYKFKWSPYEASIVTVPADISVGVGRHRRDKPEGEPKEISIDLKKDLTPTLKDEKSRRTEKHMEKTAAELEAERQAKEAQRIDVKEVESKAIEMERKRVSGITELSNHFAKNGIAGGRKIDTSVLAGEFIRDGKTKDEFQDAVVRGNFKDAKFVEASVDANVGMEKKDLERYSIVRAISRLASKQPLDGVEKAAHEAHVKLTGRESDGLGFFIPHDVMSFNRGGISEQVRALFTNVYAAAGAFVGTDLLAGSMIELLRNKLAVVRLGARTLSGLTGNVAIPLQSGGATASWLAENATISESTQTVGQLGLTPHRLGAATAYTYQLLAQSSVDVENFVREDLMRVIAIAKDLAAIAGTGVSGQPLGILNTTNLSTSVTFANAQTMLYADALAFENNVALNNADLGKLGYLTTPTVRKNAKATAEISAANSVPVWKDDKVNGFQAFATNQVPTATSVIFGNWDDLILADWAGSQVIVDPYSLSLQGQVRVVMQQLCDNGLRHSKSFAVSTN